MDGIHDMGGTQGWGTVIIDPDEPVFAEPWEGKAFAYGALSARLSGTNLDAMRHAIDRQHPYDYLVDGYYGRWLGCVETLLVDSGVLAPGRGRGAGQAAEGRGRRGAGRADAEQARLPTHCGRFAPGDPGPAPVRGRTDRCGRGRGPPTATPGSPATSVATPAPSTALLPAQVLPDTHAHFIGENAQHVYAVEFDSADLWGPDSETFALTISLYESYLEPA